MTEDYIFEMLYITFRYTRDDLSSGKRNRELAMTRMLASYLLVMHCNFTRVYTAKLLKVDHTTVIYHIQQVNNAIDGFDDRLFKHISKLEIFPWSRLGEILKIKRQVLDHPNKSLIEILKQYIKENENKEIEPQKLHELLGRRSRF